MTTKYSLPGNVRETHPLHVVFLAVGHHAEHVLVVLAEVLVSEPDVGDGVGEWFGTGGGKGLPGLPVDQGYLHPPVHL